MIAAARLLVGLVTGLGGLMAADLDEQAWMLGIERLPPRLDYTISAPNGRFSGSLETESTALVGGWRGTFASPGQPQGLMALAEGAVIGATFGGGSFDAAELRAGLGWAYAIERHWTVWVSGRGTAGVGRLAVTDENTGSPSLAGSGWGWLAGVGGSWAWSDSWALTVRADWRDERWNLSANDSSMSLGGAGPVLGVGLEWRPSWRPRGLE